MESDRIFSAKARPDGVLEIDGSLDHQEATALRAAWFSVHAGHVPAHVAKGLEDVTLQTLILDQRRVVSALQTRLARDTNRTERGTARSSGEVKDGSLALAAAVDKLYVLHQIEAGSL